MAIRNIVTLGDPVLTKKCREVTQIDERILALLDDMVETLYHSGGVGLAAPQIGVLRRIAVIDVGDGLMELINPVIIHAEGSQTDNEGCLSYPGHYGMVTRPNLVTVQALDRNGNTVTYTGEGLTARAFCHELDHLDGKMFIDYVTEWMDPEAELS